MNTYQKITMRDNVSHIVTSYIFNFPKHLLSFPKLSLNTFLLGYSNQIVLNMEYIEVMKIEKWI